MFCISYGQIFRDFFLEIRHIKFARTIRVKSKIRGDDLHTEGGVFGTSDGEHFGSSQALVAVAKKAEVSLGAVTIHNVYPFYYARFGIFQSPTEFFSYPLREGAGHRSQGTQYRKSPSPKRDHSLQ